MSPVTSHVAVSTLEPPTRHPRRYVIWAVILVAFAAVFWWVFHDRTDTKKRVSAAAVTVVPATAQHASLPVYLDAIGTVTPVHTVLVTSQASGVVTAVHYVEGQLVDQGTPLIDIDPRASEAALQQAEGALERDTQVLAQARMDLERYRVAWAKDAIAKQQFEDQEKLALQTEGTVENDRGTVALDKVQLSYCHITAPITGRVGLRLVDPGNVVTAGVGTTLLVITEIQPISVVFTVSEDELANVLEQAHRGAQLPVEAWNRTKTKQLASGTLITVDNQIDTTTGTVKLRALFANADEALFPNQFVNTRLLVRTIDSATTVPTSAIQHDGNVAFVYVVRDAHAHVQHVTPGVVVGDATQIDGLATGAVVANSSFDKLQDGATITTAPGRGPAL